MFREDRARYGQLNSKERAAIVAFTEAGKSIREISNTLGIAQSTVVCWQKRHRDTGDVERKAGSGRPRKTNPEEDRRIRAAVAAKPITTAREIAGISFFN